ncbi:HAD family hydrolase [Marinobacter sp. V034]|uniref:HAD family hydrolase n=1 Tax=Marinobacter sp. V034 TaxID=3459610 RepID=UPI00404455BD
MRKQWIRLIAVLALFTVSALASAENDPLPSWNEGQTKTSIVDFVQRVTDKNSSDFVPAEARIVTLDNDGTLWAEQPVYFQVYYALDRLREMAPNHPEWKTTEPFKSALAANAKGLKATGMEGVTEALLTAHSDISGEAFKASVSEWLATARHPTRNMAYNRMVYQPMLELLDYLRANDFKTYIVSGGGIDFIRAFAEETYGIPPEQVVGTTSDARYDMQNGVPRIIKTGKMVLVDDKEGKPVGIYRHIGRRPIMAVGNSDGDLQMLEYTTIPRETGDKTARLGVLLHHTDAEREWAYDRDSAIGKFDKGLEEAPGRGWVVIDMKKDWKQVFPDSK